MFYVGVVTVFSSGDVTTVIGKITIMRYSIDHLAYNKCTYSDGDKRVTASDSLWIFSFHTIHVFP